MTDDGPICVRRAATLEEAEIVRAWLDSKGVEARVLGRDNPGAFAFGVTDVEGFAIVVPSPSDAERARTLLEQHDREHGESP